ncbi:MAG TPA: hypothetical protein VM658_07060 [bacterium]|nr:hypothetical protein [bacterium]
MASPSRSRAASPVLTALEHHPHLGALAGFVVLTLLFFSRALPGDFIFRDSFHEYYAVKQLWGWALDGHLALWNPGTCLGMSLAGAVYPALWYPLNWLLFPLLRLPSDHALMAYTLLHFALAGTGMVFMLRTIGVGRQGAWAGAVAYAFGGYLVSQHYAANLLGGMALMPAAAGMMARARADGLKWCFFAGVITGLIYLAGDPQVFALTLIVAALMMLTVRPAGGGEERGTGAGRLIAGALIYAAAALAAAAAEMLPSLTVAAESARSAGIDFASATCWSTHPLRVLEFFLARPFGDAWPADHYWGGFMGERCFPLPLVMSPYLGMWTLLACVAAWRKVRDARTMMFTGLLLFFLALALGRHFPLYKLLFVTVPGFSAFRYPEKYLFMVTFCMAALTGIGTDRIGGSARPVDGKPGQGGALLSPRSLAAPAAVIVLTVCVGVAGKVFRAEIGALLMPLLRESAAAVTPGMAADDVINALTGAGFFTCLSLFAWQALRKGRRGLAGYAPAVVLFLDLCWANSGLAPAAPGLYRMPSRLAEIILAREGRPSCASEKDGGPAQVTPPCCAQKHYEPCAGTGAYRIFRDNRIPAPAGLTYEETRRWERDTLKPNLGLIEGFEYFGGLNVAEPRRFEWLMERVITFDRLPVFNVKYAIIPEREQAGTAQEAVPLARLRGASLVEFREVFPRAYWMGRAGYARGENEVAALFAANDFKKSVIIEPETGGEGAGAEAGDRARWPDAAGTALVPARVASYYPDTVELEVDAPAAGWLVLNDLFYPGWTAVVDGAPARIHRANGLARAVRVGAGRHKAVFRYQPRGLWPGLALTGACGIAGMAMLLAGVIKRKGEKGMKV